MQRLNCVILSAAAAAMVPVAAFAATPVAPTPLGNPGEWVSTDDYPAEALREGRSGLVAFRVTIDPQGGVSGCEVSVSSGSGDLDAATCALITQRAKFRPAVGADGKPMVGSYMNRVRWTLPTPTPQQLPMMVRCGVNEDLQMICLT